MTIQINHVEPFDGWGRGVGDKDTRLPCTGSQGSNPAPALNFDNASPSRIHTRTGILIMEARLVHMSDQTKQRDRPSRTGAILLPWHAAHCCGRCDLAVMPPDELRSALAYRA